MVQFGEDPFVQEVQFAGVQVLLVVLLGLGELFVAEFEGVPDFVAEFAVAGDALNVEVDAAGLDHIGQQAESQRIGPTLRNALRELLLFLLNIRLKLLLGQIAIPQLIQQIIQRRPLNYLQGVNYIAL